MTTHVRDDSYIETRVMTADPHRLHLLVVDGALLHARRAAEALEEGNVERGHLALGAARDFVSELLSGLDPERAPEIVANLRSLFVFVHKCLLVADVDHEPQPVRDAVRVLELHREAWVELGEQLKNSGEMPAAGAHPTVPRPHVDLHGDTSSSHDWTT